MEILLARQPIFDREEHLVGYELFYRGTVDAERSPRADAGETADRAILQACLDHGLEQLAGGMVAFGGGIPLHRDGELVGAVGVSAGSVDEDVTVATAAAAAFQS
jgi:hypothetical protein